MDKKGYYKYLFIVSAFFNWISAIAILLMSILNPNIFSDIGMSYPPTLFFLHALLGLIFTFGIGYFIVSLDITKNQGAVIIGIVSKLMFFWVCLIYFFLGDINLLILVTGFCDLGFACLFIEFLVNSNKFQ